MKVSIGLCTYKREYVLETLKSLMKQELPEGVVINEVIVVDNDKDRSAEKLIQTLDIPESFNLKYINEPEKNISAARNQILNNVTGDWLALLDDDETADPTWLKSFVEAAATQKAVAFFGPVISVYPDNTPDWVRQGRFFDREIHDNGAQLVTGATCNAFVDMKHIRARGIQFSKFYGLTGGEDSHLFYGLYESGQVLRWVSKARVREQVEARRLNEEYLIKQNYRIGQTFSRYRYNNRGNLKAKVKFIAENIAKLSASSVMSAALKFKADKSVADKVEYMKWKLRAVDAKGKLQGLSGKKYVEIYNT